MVRISSIFSGLACLTVARLVYLYYVAINLTLPEHYFFNTTQFAAIFGHGMHEHNITTYDGGTVTVFRLLAKERTSANMGPPVVIVQGLFGSSDISVILGPENSLVYRLVEEGYDVWLFNDRSTVYFKPNPTPPKYIRDGLHEVGIYDFPAVLDAIVYATGYDKVAVITQSIGTGKILITLSELPEYNEKVTVAIHLTPVTCANLGYLSCKGRIMFNTLDKIEGLVRYAIEKFQTPLDRRIERIYFVIHVLVPQFFGFVSSTINADLKEEMLSIYTVRAALGRYGHHLRDTLHCTQNKEGIFLKSPYLPIGTGEELSYDVRHITVPTKAYYIPNDDLIDNEVFEEILKRMPNVLGAMHIDFNSHTEIVLKSNSNKSFITDLLKTLKSASFAQNNATTRS